VKVKIGDPMEKRRLLYERFQVGEHEPFCRPDASSRMQIPKPSGKGADPLIVYWEIDRSTNSPGVEREKTFGYQALLDTQTFQKHWPPRDDKDQTVRVFYVCPSQERINSIVAEIRAAPVSRFYRFAIRAEMLSTNAVTGTIWQDVEGKRYAIVRR
jgi:hypothetical protein